MLTIFNDIRPFCEDVFREISVREYARMRKISPPTASTLLKAFAKEGMLVQRGERNLLLFRANRESGLFRDLALGYWKETLRTVLEPLREKFLFRKMILFGSIIKIENRLDSDVDLFVDIPYTKLNLVAIEKVLKRDVQIHFSNALKNEHLKETIHQGVML